MPDAIVLTDEQREAIQRFFDNFFEKEKKFLLGLRRRTEERKGVSYEDVLQKGKLDFCESFHTIKTNMTGFFKQCLWNAKNHLWKAYNSKFNNLVSLTDSEENGSNFEPRATTQTEKAFEAAILIKKLFRHLNKEEAILLRDFWEGVKDEKAGQRLNITGSAVRQRRSRTFIKCRKLLGVTKSESRRILKMAKQRGQKNDE